VPSACPVALLLCALLALPAAAVPPGEPGWMLDVRRIHLSPQPQAGSPPEVRVSSGQSTVLVFDAPVTRHELPGEERFGRVRLARDTLVLLPGPGLEAGETWTLAVHFADEAVPASVKLRLVVHAALAERQVEVYRHPRGAEALQAELLEKQGQVQRCQAEVARLQAAQARPDGLGGWLDAEDVDDRGVPVKIQALVPHPRNALLAERAWAYRAARSMAVRFELKLPGGRPWEAGGAALQAKAGPRPRVLRVLLKAPIAPGEKGLVVVEVKYLEGMFLGPYTLTVEEAGGTRSVTLGNLIFP